MPSARPYRTDKSDERGQVMEAMIEQRIRSGSTLEQIAKEHGVCIRTVSRWKATDQWRSIEDKWRRIMREESRTEIGETASDAIHVLQDLMHDVSVSAFTRMNCAKTLLELSGVGEELEEAKVDQQDELLEFLKRVDNRPKIPAQLINAQVLEGGLVPPEVTALAGVIDAEYTVIESALDSPDTSEDSLDD